MEELQFNNIKIHHETSGFKTIDKNWSPIIPTESPGLESNDNNWSNGEQIEYNWS